MLSFELDAGIGYPDGIDCAVLTVTPQLESDSVVALLAHANTGRWACVVPEPWLQTLRPAPGVRVLALLDPSVTARIAVITPAAEPARY
ncbi:hypothetical protein [Nocardia sp. MDA0666]|uniref:hypothetical protein n=1 Tax=Nocardia sp. MDA0666 TaxID=2135448 RepID=UPI0018EA6DD8|nr:hypothetical protein [Nocardia sp. MDA0666]